MHTGLGQTLLKSTLERTSTVRLPPALESANNYQAVLLRLKTIENSILYSFSTFCISSSALELVTITDGSTCIRTAAYESQPII